MKTPESSKKNRILLLGCGYVSHHCISYLAAKPENVITVVAKSWKNLGNASVKFFDCVNVRFHLADISDCNALDFLVSHSDLIISLVPYVMHPMIYDAAVKHNKNVVTTSYITEKLQSYDKIAKEKKLIFFNEVGVDPGIDHVYAIKIINEIHKNKGVIESFTSYCGGLPKLEYSHDNPLRYKFSWSVYGVLLALTNNAKFIHEGAVVTAPAERLMDFCKKFEINEGGECYHLIGYPNRDSTSYLERYDIRDAKEVIRGTLRFPEFVVFVKVFHALGLLDKDPKSLEKAKKEAGDATLTWERLITLRLGLKFYSEEEVAKALMKLGIVDTMSDSKKLTQGLKALNMLSHDPVEGSEDILGCLAANIESVARYGPGETDMVTMVHEIVARYGNGAGHSRKKIVCSAMWLGEKADNTAMGKTVGITCGITAQIILSGQIVRHGVLAPVTWDLAEPIYNKLVEAGITMKEIIEDI